MSEYVTSGAMMTCACGAAPSQLEVTSNTFYFIQGKLAATTADNVPMVNIRPFGTCTMKPTMGGFLPCIPAPTMWSGFVDSVRVGRGFPLLNTCTIQCATGGLISFQNSGQMKPNKARVNPSSPQIDALLRAAKEAKPFCEICEYVEEEKKNPQILRMYCIDEQEQERIELTELEERRKVILCVEVEEGGAGEKVDIEVNAPEGQKFKDGTATMKFTNVEVESDNTAYVNDFYYELKSDCATGNLYFSAIPSAGSRLVGEAELIIKHIPSVIVASFEAVNNSRNPRHGFDWVTLQDNSDTITEHHGINLSQVTHYLDKESHTYVRRNNETNAERDNAMIQAILQSEFEIFGFPQRLYSAQAWLHLPNTGVDVQVKMKLSGNYVNVPLVFDIPRGLTLTYNKRVIENNSANGDTFTANTIFTIRATESLGEVQIRVKRQCDGECIGLLGVYAYEQRQVDVFLWAVVRDEEQAGSVMYNEVQQRALEQELNRIFHQVGINMTLQEGGTISYSMEDERYSTLFDEEGDRRNRFRGYNLGGNGRVFFDKIIADYHDVLNPTRGINFMITDARCSRYKGLGRIGRKDSIVFYQTRTNYGVVAHEIGHNLGLFHSFHDDCPYAGSDRAVQQNQERVDRINQWITNLKDELTKEEDVGMQTSIRDEIQVRKGRIPEIRTEIERLLFARGRTNNVMDYTNSFDYFFRWQWREMRRIIDENTAFGWRIEER